jgi:hypothetical protein
MPGDAVHAVDGLTSSFGPRVRALRETAARHRTLRDRLETETESRRVEVATLQSKATKLTMVSELFRSLMDKLVEKQKAIVEGLVTEGLEAIFHDQELSFEAEVVQRANRVEMDLFLKQGKDALVIKDNPLDAFGGGPSTIVSLFLRVFALRRLGRAPLLLLDETLPAISAEYVEATGRFLQRLCASMGVDVLLVTHKPEFLDHADHAYMGHEEALDGGYKRLGLRHIRGKAA